MVIETSVCVIPPALFDQSVKVFENEEGAKSWYVNKTSDDEQVMMPYSAS